MTRSPYAALITIVSILFLSITCKAEEIVPHLTVGSQEISLSAGYLLPVRLTDDHSTKQSGPAFMPSWTMVLTDPVGWR